MTNYTFTTFPAIKCLDPDKAVAAPNKYRRNDNRRTKTTRHNKTVLFRRG